jgi:hypothetical protein
MADPSVTISVDAADAGLSASFILAELREQCAGRSITSLDEVSAVGAQCCCPIYGLRQYDHIARERSSARRHNLLRRVGNNFDDQLTAKVEKIQHLSIRRLRQFEPPKSPD